MRNKFFLSCVAALLLAGFVWAEEEPKDAPEVVGWSSGGPADVLVLQAESDEREQEQTAPNQQAPMESNDGSLNILQKHQGSLNKALIDGPMTMQGPGVMFTRKLGEFWVGIECTPAMPVLRVHLNLPENQGLVVSRVIPESPAAKAGVEANDILLQAGEKKLAAVDDLIEAVESAKETPLKMELIHAGKPKSVEIAPAKRPQDVLYWHTPAPADMNKLQTWVGEIQSGQISGEPGGFSFRVIQPGAILPPGDSAATEIPKNMLIRIDRKDDQPAKITVTWNDKKWEVTEKELDKLPPEARPHVERMLGHAKKGGAISIGSGAISGGGIATINGGTLHISGGNTYTGSTTINGGGLTKIGSGTLTLSPTITAPATQPPNAKAEARPRRSVEDRLDEIDRKLDELRKELRERREERQPPARSENDGSEDLPDLPGLPEK